MVGERGKFPATDDLGLEFGDPGVADAKERLIPGERLREQEQMVTRIGERPLALSRLGIHFLFAQFEREFSDLVLELNLAKTFAGGVVVVAGSFAGELQSPLPEPVRKFCDIGGHPR